MGPTLCKEENFRVTFGPEQTAFIRNKMIIALTEFIPVHTAGSGEISQFREKKEKHSPRPRSVRIHSIASGAA